MLLLAPCSDWLRLVFWSLEAVAAILCAFFTRLFIEYVQPICYLPTVLSGIIWLLPGTSIRPAQCVRHHR